MTPHIGLSLSNAMVWLPLAAAAPAVGSFLGVVASRLPNGEDVLWSRSRCDRCKTELSASDLIPVASWICLGRRCRYCQSSLGYFYPIVEVAALLIVVWAATVVSGAILVASALFGWLLLCLGIADWRSQRLPDVLTLTLGLLGLGAAWFFDSDRLLEHFIAALLGGGLLLVISFVYRQTRGRDGLGFGDAKLFAGIGAWVSLGGLPSVLFLAALLAMVAFLARLWMSGIDWHERITFGPFLAAAAWLVWLYGPLVPAVSF